MNDSPCLSSAATVKKSFLHKLLPFLMAAPALVQDETLSAHSYLIPHAVMQKHQCGMCCILQRNFLFSRGLLRGQGHLIPSDGERPYQRGGSSQTCATDSTGAGPCGHKKANWAWKEGQDLEGDTTTELAPSQAQFTPFSAPIPLQTYLKNQK